MAAGRRLNLVPSGISAHIAALERETGIVVLDRSRRDGQVANGPFYAAIGVDLAGHKDV